MKKIYKYISFLIFFISLLLGIFYYLNNYAVNIYNIFSKFSAINSARISIEASTEMNDLPIIFSYDFNYQDDYNNSKFNNVKAFDGVLGIEIPSHSLGLYFPLQMTVKDDVNFFFTVDKSYELLGLPSEKNIHGSLNSFRKNLGIKIEYNELENIALIMKPILLDYIKLIKTEFILDGDFKMFSSDSVGTISKTLTQKNIDDLLYLIKSNLSQELFSKYKFETIHRYLIENYLNASLVITVLNNNIHSITLLKDNNYINVEISNINQPNTINIPTSNYVEMVSYLKDNVIDIFSLFGLELEIEYTRLEFLKKSLETFILLMNEAIIYSYQFNIDYAENNIKEMNVIISNMKNKIFDKGDVSVNDVTYNCYIDLFQAIVDYCTLYKESYANLGKDYSSTLDEKFEIINQLAKKLNIDLDLDLN